MAGTTTPMNLPYPTDSDLVQGVDEAIQALAEAVDANLPRGALAAGTLAADATAIGAVDLFTFNLTPGAARVLGFRVGLDIGNTGQPGTGVSIVVKRDGVQVGQGCGMVYHGSGFTEHYHVEVYDTATTAGAHVYTVTAGGYGANGQTVKAGTRCVVEDLGPL